MLSKNINKRRQSNRLRGISEHKTVTPPRSIYATARIPSRRSSNRKQSYYTATYRHNQSQTPPDSPSTNTSTSTSHITHRTSTMQSDAYPSTDSVNVPPLITVMSSESDSPPMRRQRCTYIQQSTSDSDTPVESQHFTVPDCFKILKSGSPLHHTLAENKSMKTLQEKFLDSISSNIRNGVVGMAHCPQCKERWIDTRLSQIRGPNRTQQCIECMDSTIKNTYMGPDNNLLPLRLLSAENDMDPWPRLDHLLLPKLNSIEEMLIALVHPFMRVYRLDGGQLGYKGRVANLEQDTYSFARILPHLPSELPCFIVRKPNVNSPSGHHDFKVNRENIMTWLHFLKENNRFYADIDLAVARTRTNTSIPEDGCIIDSLRVMEEGMILLMISIQRLS